MVNQGSKCDVTLFNYWYMYGVQIIEVSLYTIYLQQKKHILMKPLNEVPLLILNKSKCNKDVFFLLLLSGTC